MVGNPPLLAPFSRSACCGAVRESQSGGQTTRWPELKSAISRCPLEFIEVVFVLLVRILSAFCPVDIFFSLDSRTSAFLFCSSARRFADRPLCFAQLTT